MGDSPDTDFDIITKPIIINNLIYETNTNIDDEFIIYFKEEKLFIGSVVEINEEDSYIVIVNEINDIFKISIDEYSNIILITDTYEIIDIEKVSEFTESEEKKDFDEYIVETLKKDIYPEINFETIEKKYQEYEYKIYDTIQILLSNIIESFDIYDNKQIISELSDNLHYVLSQKELNENHYLNKYNNIPSWIRPISTNYKKVYVDEIDDIVIDKPYINVDQSFEEKKIRDIKDNANNLFDLYLKESVSEFNPTQSIDKSIGIEDKYEGRYFMNMKDFEIDERQTRGPILYYDSSGFKKKIIENDLLGIDELILFPNKYFNMNINFSMTQDMIPLNTKLDLYDLSKHTNLQKNVSEAFSNGIIKIDISKSKEYSNKKIMIYKLNNSKSVFDVLKQAKNTFPSIKDFIEDIDIPIYNYNDIDYLLLQYKINHKDMNIEDKLYVNFLIKNSLKNIKPDSKPVKKRNIDKKKRNRTLDIKKIKLLIFNLSNINLKNYYLDKFIDKYTKSSINSNWLLNIYTDEHLLCKHHKTSCKITTDKNAYESLIDNWAGDTIDGYIYCKNCNEYITHEDFSLFEGFTGDKPIITKEELTSKLEDEMSSLSENQLNDINLIQMLSVNIGVTLTNEDSIHILNLYKLLDESKFTDHRYGMINVIEESYPSLVNAKSKITKEKFNKLKIKIKKYIQDTNKVLFFYICILLLIQTNIPGYKNTPDGGELLDFKNKNFLESLSKPSTIDILNEGVSLLFKKIRSLSTSLKGLLWSHCKIFVDEKIIQSSPRDQIKNIIQYLFTPFFPSMLKKIKNYYINNISDTSLFLKKFWNTYKPLPNDKLVVYIRNILNNENLVKEDKPYYLKQNLIENMLENSGYLIDINNTTPKYKQYSIQISDIMINASFDRLYNYTIYLYGIHEHSDYINLLIDRFIHTIDKKHQLKIKEIFEKGGWNQLTLSFKKPTIDFSNLKKILISVITYYKQFDKKDIELNDHDIFNNIRLMYISTLPKRIYESTYSNIFSNVNEERLLDKLKKRYCYDIHGKLIINDTFKEHYISLELPINKMIGNCVNNIKKESIQDIISLIHSQNKLEPIYPYIEISPIYEYIDRVLLFIDNIKYEDELIYLLGDNTKKYIDTSSDKSIFNDIYKQIQMKTEEYIFDYIDFIQSSEQLENALDSMKTKISIFGKDFKNIIHLFYPPEPGNSNYNENNPDIELSSELIDTFYEYIIKTTSIISNEKQGDYSIHNWWKLSPTNNNTLNNFLQENYLVNHNELFIQSKNKYSFMIYYHKSIYFKKLIEHIDIQLLSEYLRGSSKSKTVFSQSRCMRIKKYSFMKLLNQMQVFIIQINDSNSNIYKKLDSEFKSFEEDYSVEDCSNTLSKYIIELMIDILNEYNDPTWILNIDKFRLNERLSLQKEREKLELTNKLDQMDANQRYVYVQKQKIGAVNWFKDADTYNQNYIESDEFKQKTLEERIEYLKKMEESKSIVTDEVQSNILDDIDDPNQEGYYNQDDLDNEGDNEEYIDMNVDDNDIMGF